MAKDKMGTLDPTRTNDAWFLKKMMEAAAAGDMQIFTSTVSIAECTHADGVIDDQVRSLFTGLLTSGIYVRLVQDSLFIAEDARNLRWDYAINLSGLDAIHIASALAAGCEEFITTDGRIRNTQGKLFKAIEALGKLGLRVESASKTRCLPQKYRNLKLPLRNVKKSRTKLSEVIQ
jgi:predicted nucleic acid-binding protein